MSPDDTTLTMGKNKHGHTRYRLTILNDNTLDTEFTTRVTRAKIIAAILGCVALVCILFYVILFATPIRKVLPGYLDSELKQQMMGDAFRIDSLEEKLSLQEAYLSLVRSMVSGSYEMDTTLSMDTLAIRQVAIMEASQDELKFRSQYEEAEKFNIHSISQQISTDGLLFYLPVKGAVDSLFNERDEHYGVDIAAERRQPVLSVLDGTVIFAGYTSAEEYVVMIQHNNDFISVYRQMSELLKNTGDAVKAGEAIAFVGRESVRTGVSHLHFELWYKGHPLNPLEYLLFQ